MTRNTFYLCAALFGVALLCSSVAFAQGVSRPRITNIPGGFFIEWASPVKIAEIKLDKRLSGPIEIMFDVPSVEILFEMDSKPLPGTSPEMVTALADYWIVRGKPERAIPLYEDSLKLGNLDEVRTFVFRNNLAMLYSQVLGQHRRALEIVDEALLEQRDNFTLLDTKGLIYLHAGQPREAIPVLQLAYELSCQRPIFGMHLSYALYLDGRLSQAGGFFNSVRPYLIPLVPTMTKENRAMYDVLHANIPEIGGSSQ